jgi:chromosome segregation ATPase
LANAGGLLSLQCNLEKDAKFIGKQLGVPFERIMHLKEPGRGYVNFSSFKRSLDIKIAPIWERATEEELQEIKKAYAAEREKLSEYFTEQLDLKKKINQLSEKLEKESEEKTELQNKIKLYSAEVQRLQNTLEKEKEKRNDLKREFDSYEREISKFKSEKIDLEKRIEVKDRQLEKHKLFYQTLTSRWKVCSACGFTNEKDANFCNECGGSVR